MKYEFYNVINTALAFLMFIFGIIIICCSPGKNGFYKFLKLYLSNNTIFDEQLNNISSDYRSYSSYYQENLEKYKININAKNIYKSKYESFKELENLFWLAICLELFDSILCLCIIRLLCQLPLKYTKEIFKIISRNYEGALGKLKEMVSQKKCQYFFLFGFFGTVNLVSDIAFLLFTCNGFIFTKKLLIGGGKYYLKIRDKFNTSITFTIFNFFLCIIFIYSSIRSMNAINQKIFGSIYEEKKLFLKSEKKQYFQNQEIYQIKIKQTKMKLKLKINL